MHSNPKALVRTERNTVLQRSHCRVQRPKKLDRMLRDQNVSVFQGIVWPLVVKSQSDKDDGCDHFVVSMFVDNTHHHQQQHHHSNRPSQLIYVLNAQIKSLIKSLSAVVPIPLTGKVGKHEVKVGGLVFAPKQSARSVNRRPNTEQHTARIMKGQILGLSG